MQDCGASDPGTRPFIVVEEDGIDIGDFLEALEGWLLRRLAGEEGCCGSGQNQTIFDCQYDLKFNYGKGFKE